MHLTFPRRLLTAVATVLLTLTPALAQDDPSLEPLKQAYERAETAVQEKNYDEAISAYEEVFKLLPEAKLPADAKQQLEQGARYNAACAYSLTGKKEEALKSFARALELGFDQWEHLEKDTDLDPIRGEQAFKDAVEKAKSAAKEELKKALTDPNGLFPYEIEFTTIADNKKVKLADLKGKVVIVDIWGTWCPPCRAEIPHFVKLHKTYEEAGLVIVGLANERIADTAKAAAKVKEFAEKNEMKYHLAAITDSDPAIKQVPDFQGYPTTLWIDREGKVRFKHVGYADYAALEAYTKTLLDAGK